MESWQYAVAYHEETKHDFHRFARSLGYMDWANQPDPFRRFEPAPLVRLGLTGQDPPSDPFYDALFEPARISAQPVSLHNISELLEYSLAISAWKQYKQARWALRINPSSGNLHPTEGYLVIGPIEGLDHRPGVYHYTAQEHALERRTGFESDTFAALAGGFPPGTFFVGLSSVHWREAWKYGERAYRYCQHDVGHALAAVALSAAVQGWHASPLDGLGDTDVARLLGLGRSNDFHDPEPEHPELMIAVIPAAAPMDLSSCPRTLDAGAIARIAAGTWIGKANRLSEHHTPWGLIDTTAEACAKPAGPCDDPATGPRFAEPLRPTRPALSARQIIRQRRSAVDMDGETAIRTEQFFVMMDRVLPRYERPPWSAFGPPTCVHLGLFVHRVEGLAPGLYFLVRRPDQAEVLRSAMRPSFAWAKPDKCPETLPLYLLLEGDARQAAAQSSCFQAIAGDGAFACAMIAEFEAPLERRGGWFYRRLHAETGVIGQVLYLEAEAAGVRSTGIGCFFDDPSCRVFGFHGRRFQTLYHFTVGGAVEDPRLTTLPPYPRRP